jgi:hypothetical protein
MLADNTRTRAQLVASVDIIGQRSTKHADRTSYPHKRLGGELHYSQVRITSKVEAAESDHSHPLEWIRQVGDALLLVANLFLKSPLGSW